MRTTLLSGILAATLAAAPAFAQDEAAEIQPNTPMPNQAPALPDEVPQPPAQGQQAPAAGGQWVYTQQYGWVWMPYGQQYTYVPGTGDPYMYCYYPGYGWDWLSAPWIFGWGPRPYWGAFGLGYFAWYSHPWFGYRFGAGWGGYRGTWGWRGGGAGYHPAGPAFGHAAAPAGHSFRASGRGVGGGGYRSGGFSGGGGFHGGGGGFHGGGGGHGGGGHR
jgi:hypothetical protein